MKHVAEPMATVPLLPIIAVLGVLCGVLAGLVTCLLWGVS